MLLYPEEFYLFTGILMSSNSSLKELPLGLLELDRQGKVIRFSPAAECYSAIRLKDVLGRDFFKEILPFSSCQEYEDRFHAFMNSGTSVDRFSFTFPSAQGTISVQVALALLPDKSPPPFAIVRLMPEPEGNF